MAENMASINLENNLNDAVSYYDFFSAFGYSDRDTVFLRTFKDKGEKDSGRNESFQLKNLSFFLKTLHEENQKDRGNQLLLFRIEKRPCRHPAARPEKGRRLAVPERVRNDRG